ncbi:MAG TPA: LytTR family DNA-binding domain-containing protein [Sphingomicrobium sp.]|nr:LytTR family DNA-binding domain-containing protein [Sphingomicrobium sp.]
MTKRTRLRGFAQAVFVIAAFGLLVDTINVFTAMHDAAERGVRLAIWEPAIWESTSFLAMLLACGIAYAALRLAPPSRGPFWKFAFVHVAATLVFSSIHVLVMNALRVAIYWVVGHHYPFGESGFFYEYGKDVVGYVIIATIFWFFTTESETPAVATSTPRTIDIRDGKKLLRVPTQHIAAVRAAGNYVEYILVDDRRPLARQSLSSAQCELGDAGFVRTHRCWLVNLQFVRGFHALGAGDCEITLEGGLKVPLSRRFPAARARLANSN